MSVKYLKILTFFICLFVFICIAVHFKISVIGKEDKDLKIKIQNGKNVTVKEVPLGTLFADLGIEDEEHKDTYVVSDNETFIIDENTENRISINDADLDELMSLPGIGPVISSRIIEYRERFGAFEAIDEIRNIKGIGDKKYEKIRELITV